MFDAHSDAGIKRAILILDISNEQSNILGAQVSKDSRCIPILTQFWSVYPHLDKSSLPARACLQSVILIMIQFMLHIFVDAGCWLFAGTGPLTLFEAQIALGSSSNIKHVPHNWYLDSRHDCVEVRVVRQLHTMRQSTKPSTWWLFVSQIGRQPYRCCMILCAAPRKQQVVNQQLALTSRRVLLAPTHGVGNITASALK